MEISFVTEPDETGKGRIVVDGRFYGLPIAAVLEYKALREQQEDDEDERASQRKRMSASVGTVPNAKVTGSPALSASPSGLPGYATEVEK